MGRVLVIGAGGVSTVAVKKIAMNADVFTDIMVASRTKSKCDKIAADIKNVKVQTAQVDADKPSELVALFEAFKPDLVVNLALPYQDLSIMDACLEYGVSYLDTANYEPLDEAKYEYSWQWAYKERFEQAGLTAILGCGFDPGVTGVYTAYAAKHHFDEEFPDHQACPFLDDFRPGVPDTLACDPEHRYGQHQADHVQRRGDRPDPVPEGGIA